MNMRGPNNVGRAVQTDPTLLRYASAITEKKKCWELLAEKFDRFQTLRNNMQQGVQTDATCNIQQCWELLVNNVASACTQPKKDGCEYEPDSLRVMLTSLDRHLREEDATFSIAKDIEIPTAEKYLKEKQGFLVKVSGKGQTLQRHSPLKTKSCYGPKECLKAILHSH